MTITLTMTEEDFQEAKLEAADEALRKNKQFDNVVNATLCISRGPFAMETEVLVRMEVNGVDCSTTYRMDEVEMSDLPASKKVELVADCLAREVCRSVLVRMLSEMAAAGTFSG